MAAKVHLLGPDELRKRNRTTKQQREKMTITLIMTTTAKVMTDADKHDSDDAYR